tara:strand:- start:381 stop:572 length:192 start_codon:yes stop_codon:yes gene_type:complete
MKKGDIIRKTIGEHIGALGIVVDIIEYIPEYSVYDNNTYAIVNTSFGVKRWYCRKMEVIFEAR